MKLRTAFFLSLLAVLVIMAVPAFLGVGHVREVRRVALDLRQRTAEAAFVVGRIQAGIERLDRYQRAQVATGDPELAERTRLTLHELERSLRRLRLAGYAGAVQEARVPIRSLTAVSSLTLLLMEAGHREAATALVGLQLGPLLTEAAASADRLAGAVDAATASRIATVDRITGDAVRLTTAALLLALLGAIALALLATRFLTRPLDRLSASMARVADGHFEAPDDLPYDRTDELGELFRAFRSMTLQLDDLDRLKAQFVSVASHDLKTPVNVISGYAELISDELEPRLQPRHAEILAALRRQARSLSSRINQLLEISRIQAAGLDLGYEEINIRHFTAELARAHQTAGSRHGISVTASVDDSTPTFLVADPDRLRREIFGSLLENALKFTPPGGHVAIRTSGHGGTVTFEVADQGPAIASDALPHAFDRYYRGRDPSGRTGSGLALAIAREAAEAHGGRIAAEAPPEGGTLIRVTLPIHPSLGLPHAEPEHA